jgi:rod shape determining protein RodA
MFMKRSVGKTDFVLIAILLLLISVGILCLMSVTHLFATGDISSVRKQIIWAIISFAAMLVVSKIDYEILGNYSLNIYGLIIFLLIAVLFTRPINGASSWFNIGFFSFQPSEIAKIVLIITLAKHIDRIMSKDEEGINNIKNLIMIFIHVGIPVFLIMRQPDFGTAMVIIVIVLSMIFLANIKYKYVTALVGLGIAGLASLRYLVFNGYLSFLNSYQVDRIKVFFDPSLDLRGSGYNVAQAKLAIGSGQLAGMGLFKGTQTQLGNIPENSTDFIFSAIGEELGFIVCAIIVISFLFLFLRGIYIAKMSKDNMGSLIVIGVMAMLGVHVFINIGMNIGLVPVTGIPLPFISYGGSSLLTNMLGIGLVLGVYAKNK